MSIGDNIKRIRKDKGLTQEGLSKLANISRSYLGDIETNRYNPSVATLQALAHALNVKTSDIIGDETKDNKNAVAIQTIATHLEDKDITPYKLKMLKRYIDDLFNEFED